MLSIKMTTCRPEPTHRSALLSTTRLRSASRPTRVCRQRIVYEQGGKPIPPYSTRAWHRRVHRQPKNRQHDDFDTDHESGIRGTTGSSDVPDNNAAGAARPKSLYPDTTGVGRIEVFNQQGRQLGALTQGSSAFAIRSGPGGQFAAIPVRISPQEAAVDRGVVQRLFASHKIGLQAVQRRLLRGPNRQQPGNQQPNTRQPNNSPPPGNPPQQNRSPGLQQKGDSGAPQPRHPRHLRIQSVCAQEK